jgi:putative flippase GtrA
MSPRSREIATFLAVGGAGFVTDVVTFNLMLTQVPLTAGRPLLARTLAVVVAMAVTYLGNRTFTWKGAPAGHRQREVTLFVLFNLIGFAASAICLVVSHDLLRLTSAWADNVSANLVGVGLGTIFRYLTYRRFVFRADQPPMPTPAAASEVERVLIVSASVGAGPGDLDVPPRQPGAVATGRPGRNV